MSGSCFLTGLIACLSFPPPMIQAGLISAPTSSSSQVTPQEKDPPWAILRITTDSQGQVWEASILDGTGNVHVERARLGDRSLIAMITKVTRDNVMVESAPSASHRAIEQTMLALQNSGIQHVHLLGPYSFYSGKLFHSLDTEDKNVIPPKFQLDMEKLRLLAEASERINEVEPIYGKRVLGYEMLIDEAGKIAVVNQLWGPDIPAITAELARTEITSPAFRGTDPFPVAVFVGVRLK